MIAARNLRRRAMSPGLPEDLCDLVIRTTRGDITQVECGLKLTVQNLLTTLHQDHNGRNGANDDALLVGECGVAGCCGVDFSVRHREADVELSWADPAELQAAIKRAARELPLSGVDPNDFEVPMVVVTVLRKEYESAILGLADAYLKHREAVGDPDVETRNLFRKVRQILRVKGIFGPPGAGAL
jgi:hypothetical protein